MIRSDLCDYSEAIREREGDKRDKRDKGVISKNFVPFTSV